MLLGKNKSIDLTKNEQYTPKWVFDKLNVKFDLDVCAPKEQTNAPVKYWFHYENDGLANEWFGNVWMNPPFSSAKPWVEKFIDHNQGIALLPFSKAHWFIKIWNKADGIMPIYDIKFELPNKKTQGIFMPVALFALGEQNKQALLDSGLGFVR